MGLLHNGHEKNLFKGLGDTNRDWAVFQTSDTGTLALKSLGKEVVIDSHKGKLLGGQP